MNNKVLVLLAHPNLSVSVANAALMSAIEDLEEVKIINLYENPFTKFDVNLYRNLINESSVIVFQFPLYWASAPSELKRWMDDVFTYLGEEKLLVGKKLLVVTTAGASESSFRKGGSNSFEMSELLCSYQATAGYASMIWQNSIVVYALSQAEGVENLKHGCQEYRKRLLELIR